MDVGWVKGCWGRKWMWGGWRGIKGRHNSRGSNKRTRAMSGKSCAHAWPLNSCCLRSSCLLIRGLRDMSLYMVNLIHCLQNISNVLVVWCVHWVTPQQTEVSFNLQVYYDY